MATFTVSIPKELKREIDNFQEIHLAEYLKKRFEIKIQELKKFDTLQNKGEL
ncbi:MAG: hypothetical protein ACMXYE_01160 [Candidatus Woesearchaeota archaeon]